jgi:hypothetical protein
MKSYVSILALSLVLISNSVQAQETISFQGAVTDIAGIAVDSLGWDATFKLYKGVTVVWEESQQIDIVDGVFNVYLGTDMTLDTVAFNQEMELGITLDGESEMSPRTKLAAAAFAKALPDFYTFFHDAGSNEGTNVVGGRDNYISPGIVGATISGGGGRFGGATPDSVTAHWGAVGGGFLNRSGFAGSVGGGGSNKALGSYSAVSGGLDNVVSGSASSIGGGSHNEIGAANEATIAGGQDNTVTGSNAAIGGGDTNTASGTHSTIAGGEDNIAGSDNSTVGGGEANTVSGAWATVPGGQGNRADGSYSHAAGRWAHATHPGSIVLHAGFGAADTLLSETNNQFLAGAPGGVKFYTNTAMSAGSELPAGSGTWSALSSRSSKTRFKEIDPVDYLDRVLSLELSEWSYKDEDPSVSHVGPMAEDFYDRFGHGPSPRTISTIDSDGVALAAIQGLYELVKKQQAEIDQLKTLIAHGR